MEKLSFNVDAKLIKENVFNPLSKLFESKDKKGDKKDVLITFECTNEKIMIKEKDTANVIFISFDLDEGIINDYETDIKEDEPIRIVLDLNKLQEAFTDLNGMVSFELDVEHKKMILKSGFYTYELGLKVQQKETKFPNLDAENKINVKGIDLYTILKKCSSVHMYVDIKLQAKSNFTQEEEFLLSFIAKESNTNTKAKVELDEFNVIKFDVKNNCINTYDTFNTGLLDVLKESVNKIPEVQLLMQNNYPLLIHYEIKDNHGKVSIGVAPRINPST